MKLSKENLQFIDTYLENSSVTFIDVRMELTDHIASAIEQELTENTNTTFYHVFKQYMIENKKSLLKNYEEQQAKIRDKIFLRFFKGFLAKEVLFFIVLVFLAPFFVTLNLSKDNSMGINLFIGLCIGIYYMIAFHKTKKTSIGPSLGCLMMIPIYLPYYIDNPFVLLLLLSVLFLFKKFISVLRKKISEGKYIGLLFIGICIFSALLITFNNYTKAFITPNIQEGYFLFQFVIWYVLCKTLHFYKKELDKKYKGIFT
jgi:hypothetical protein